MITRLRQVQSRKALPITSAVTFLGFLDTHLLIPVMAIYAAELGASVGFTGLIIGLYSITNTPANVLFGRLIDKVGYRAPLIAGLAGDALSMFLYSLCRLPIHLALVRALHGVTGGLVGPATMSATASYSDSRQKGRTMAFYGMSLAAATLAGYALSGIIVSHLDYKTLFLIGALIVTIGLILSFSIPRGERKGAATAKTSLGESAKKARDLLRRRGLFASYSSIFAQYFTFGSVVTLLPLYVNGLGMETFHVSMIMAIFASMFIAIQFPSGILSDKIGRLTPTAIGLSLGIASLIMIPSVGTFPLLASMMALYGVGYGMLFPSISALVADHTVPEERGTATGIFHALLTAGVAAGALVMGWVGEVVGVELALALSSGGMAIALVVALTALKRA